MEAREEEGTCCYEGGGGRGRLEEGDEEGEEGEEGEGVKGSAFEGGIGRGGLGEGELRRGGARVRGEVDRLLVWSSGDSGAKVPRPVDEEVCELGVVPNHPNSSGNEDQHHLCPVPLNLDSVPAKSPEDEEEDVAREDGGGRGERSAEEEESGEEGDLFEGRKGGVGEEGEEVVGGEGRGGGVEGKEEGEEEDERGDSECGL